MKGAWFYVACLGGSVKDSQCLDPGILISTPRATFSNTVAGGLSISNYSNKEKCLKQWLQHVYTVFYLDVGPGTSITTSSSTPLLSHSESSFRGPRDPFHWLWMTLTWAAGEKKQNQQTTHISLLLFLADDEEIGGKHGD